MLGLLGRRADERSSSGTIDKTSRAVISGSRLFNTIFGLPRNGENIARFLGAFQSGSPPDHDFGELSRVVPLERHDPTPEQISTPHFAEYGHCDEQIRLVSKTDFR
jgi:hypothetical protein